MCGGMNLSAEIVSCERHSGRFQVEKVARRKRDRYQMNESILQDIQITTYLFFCELRPRATAEDETKQSTHSSTYDWVTIVDYEVVSTGPRNNSWSGR